MSTSRSIGIVTNVNNTDLIYFARKPVEDLTHISDQSANVAPKETIKMLGVLFDSDLLWNSHTVKLKHKAAFAFKKFKFLVRYIDFHGMKRIITTHLYSMLYYSPTVWLNEQTTMKTVLNCIHYKGLSKGLLYNTQQGLTRCNV